MTITSPQGAPTSTVVSHIDDIAWTEVQRQLNGDGTVSAIREKWPIIRPGFLSAHVHYEPAMVVRRHGHRSNHVVFVLGGGASIGDRWCAEGTHVHVPLGAAFGPIVAGPEGLTCWELSFGEFGGWGDQPELYEREIVARGITPLPDPPIELGDWFVDPRGDWGAERSTPRVEGLAERFTDLGDLCSIDFDGATIDHRSPGTVRVKPVVTEPAFSSAWVELGAATVVPHHRPKGHVLAYLVQGSATIAERRCTPGTHVEVPAGGAVGPIVAGVDGAAFLVLTDGDRLSRAEADALFTGA